ncbi:MAG: hypothetical protein AAGD96_01615 [Chloroflexota bacterium]
MIEFNGNLANVVALGSLILASLCLLFVSANPHRLRRVTNEQLTNLLPAKQQKEILTLADAWAGRSQVTPFQTKMIAYGGLLVGVTAGLASIPLIGTGYGVLLATIFGGLLWYYPKQRFAGGFRKSTIEALEREAPVFAAFMHRAVGITGLSVQMAFEQFLEVYPEKETSKLISQIPEGIPYPDAILDLGLPVTQVPNWIQVIQVIGSISEFGDPESILKEMRDRIRKREEQYLRMMIKRKAFAAPAATVVIMLPGLMCVLIGSVLLQAIRTLTGGF